MSSSEQKALCREFGLGQFVACERLGGTRNQNFLLHTMSGTWFVRHRCAAYSAPERIAFDHEAIDFLNGKGVAVVPPRRTIAGASHWINGEAVWEVFPAVRARHLRDGDAQDVRPLAAALAAFHLAGRSFNRRCDKLGPRGETDPAEMREIARAIRQQTPACDDALKTYEQWMAAAALDLTDATFGSLPHTLVHGDVQPANILVDGGRVAAFVDLDWCAWRPRIYDLAFAILLCCATHETPIRGEDIWSLSQPPQVQDDLARLFLQTYSEHGWPLEAREASVLRPQLVLSWCHVRLAGAMKIEPSRRQEFLARPPHRIDALFSGAPA